MSKLNKLFKNNNFFFLFRTFIITLLFLLLSPSIYCQSVMSGKVVDENESPLEYVNVLLLNTDSTYVNGSVTNEKGIFAFSNIQDNKYLIKLTYLGFEDQLIHLDLGVDSIPLIKMKSSSFSLNEVTVSAERKFFSIKNGNLTMDIQNTNLKSLGNGMDILSRLPGVINDGEDNISVIGKGTPLIYINGRIIHDINELKRLNSNDILSVEFVGTPGAQYDSETKSVIKISTIKRQKDEGFSFRVQGIGTQGRKFSYSENIDLTYKVNKFDIRVSLYDYNSRKKSNGTYDTHMSRDTIWEMYDSSKGYSKYRYDNISSNINYEFNDKHNINILYNFTHSNPIMYNNNSMKAIADSKLFTDLNYHSIVDEQNNDHRLNFSYLGKIKKITLDVNLDYYTKNNKQDQTNNELTDLGDRIVKTDSRTDYDILAAKIIVNYDLSTNTSLNSGVDLSHTKRDGIFYNLQNIIPNTNTSVKEDRNAVFIGLSSKINKVSLGGGLRYEYQQTQQKDKSTSIPVVLHDKDYHSILPNFNISYPLSNIQLSLSVSQRLKRPTYFQLREGIQYNGRFEYDKGNPLLKQAKTTVLSLSGVWQNLYVNVGYNRTKDYIGIFFYQDEVNSSLKIATPINYNLQSDFNLNVSYNKKISFWNPQISMTCIFPHLKVQYMDKNRTLDKTYAFFQLYNDFTTNNKYIFGLDFFANTSGNIGESYIYSQIYTNISARKSYFDNSLDVSLKLNDIFKSNKRKSSNSIGTVYYSRDQYNDTRAISLTITYKYNNYKTKRRKSMAGDEEINRTY